MNKGSLQVHRINLFFTQEQIDQLNDEAKSRTLSRASLVRDLVQKFLNSIRKEEEAA